MKRIAMARPILLLGICWMFSVKSYAQLTNLKQETKMETNQTTQAADTARQILIDHFIVPEGSKKAFYERMEINRNFIKQLPGFVEDAVYERIDEKGNLVCTTIAVWANEDAINKAREAVQAEYRRQNFNLPEMLKRLNIVIDRGIYKRRFH
jgi:hypothetical protein